ncbi:recombinase family protein, partial [bacterium]|nr:recombinase family protein [bacterium]
MKNKRSTECGGKAVIYCRVSTDDQAQGTSLETQEAECRGFAEQLGLEVVCVFKGKGESAKTTDRPAFQAMLKFCNANKGKVEAVIVWKLDRFSRNAGDANQEKAKLVKIGVQVDSATEPALNEDNPAARLTFTVLAGVAQFDNEIRAERAVTGMKRRVEEGCWTWCPPFGYRSCPKGADRERHREHGLLEPIPELVPLIKEAFRILATGHYSVKGTFEELRKKGLIRINGKTLCVRSLRNILRSPIYCGYMDAFGERRKGKWEPLVSVETFETVQNVLDGHGFVKRQT